MQPGPELDKAIAEAMGVKPTAYYHEGARRESYQPYSINWSAAALVIEHMRSKGWRIWLENFGDGFTVQFIKWGGPSGRVPELDGAKVRQATAPAAICLAALSALAPTSADGGNGAG